MRIAHLLAGLTLAAAPGLAHAADPWDGGDPVAGKAIFTSGHGGLPCAVCHYAEAGKNKIGPTLWGVVGRPSATVASFTYSDAMKAYNHVWTPQNLFVYLEAPMKVVPGTKMTFPGLPSETDRKNVIAYLATLK
ncbi:MAG: cytochrome c family protein [Rhodospirillales bacterium]